LKLTRYSSKSVPSSSGKFAAVAQAKMARTIKACIFKWRAFSLLEDPRATGDSLRVFSLFLYVKRDKLVSFTVYDEFADHKTFTLRDYPKLDLTSARAR
jgi:hypothetical protein